MARREVVVPVREPDLPVSKEIRDPYDRLEVREQLIQQLQADVNEIKTTLHSLEVERGEYAEFRKIILAWMKHYEQQQIDRSSGTSNSSGLFSPSNSNFDSIQVSMGVLKAVTQLQLPEFNGIDPHGWLQQANLYFDFNNTPDELRLHLIQFRMVGVAHHWFTALIQIWESITWLEFQSELLQHFNGFEIPTPYEQSESIHASVIDFVAGKAVESVAGKASLAFFCYQSNYGPVTCDGPQVLGQGEPKRVNTPKLTKRGFPACSDNTESVPFTTPVHRYPASRLWVEPMPESKPFRLLDLASQGTFAEQTLYWANLGLARLKK
ncbi:hypothetical protein E3N88_20085 [Mikania micrantha]|uniref:Retrotransposon gag domain-containing protein n=1 Tax=Mikania micrantha TaxID=192012 RepID=A0A5N6NG40_9ASTR|nr:hypothetical protein E3N88_20085 [Mikania micrantha]